jgi:hypothetical protein
MLHPFPSGETKCSIGGGIVVEDERRQDCTVAWQDCTVAWQDCTVAGCICTDSGCGTRHDAVLHRHRSTVPAGPGLIETMYNLIEVKSSEINSF